MTQEQPLVVRAQGRPDGDRLPIAEVPPFPGRSGGWPGVRWVEDGTLLAVTTWGSSSHPVVPRTARVSDGELVLTLGAPGEPQQRRDLGGPVTADMAATTTLVEPPAGLDPHVHTRVLLGGRAMDLPPAGTPLAPRIDLRPLPATPPPPPEPGPRPLRETRPDAR